MTRSHALTLNALGLYAVALVLVIAFAAQLLLNELPCPLCLLQRIQFAMLAVGPILNLRFGPRPSHYAVSLFTAIAGAAFATRQILLHIMPGDLGYGSLISARKVSNLSSRMGWSVPSRSCPPRTPRGAWPASSCWHWR